MSAVVVQSVIKRFGERAALDGVSFTVEEGELFCLLGPNGSGKTTLFRILSTLLSADEGQLTLAGHDVANEPSAVRAQLGVVFQNPSLDEKLTVGENLRYGGNMYGLRGEELRDRIAHVAAELRLTERLPDRVETLSGGLRRRVELAKALLAKASILLLDEPSTGIDPAARLEIWALIDTLRREHKLTVIFTTHLMDEAERSDRIAILDHGKLVAIDTPQAFLAEAGTSVVRISTRVPEEAAAAVRRALNIDPLVLEGELRVRGGGTTAFNETLTAALEGLSDSLTVARPTMDDVFLIKTGHRFSS